MNGLKWGLDYYFAVDAFNGSGFTRGTTTSEAPATP